MFLVAMLLALPDMVNAQFTFTTNNGAITITRYTGSGSIVVIPGTTNGYPVANIGTNAFQNITTLTSVTIPSSVTNIGDGAFSNCGLLREIYLQGNAPSLGSAVFTGDNNATIYYLPGTSGWSSSFGGHPAWMLNPPNPAGSLKVTLSPAPAIMAGAQWQVDGGVAQPSSATVLGLSVGNHTVTFSPLNGWWIPASQSVTVSANLTATVNVTYGKLTYTTNNGAISITGYITPTPNGAVILPGTINGRSVTRIMSDAFQFCTLTNVTIPGNVTNIGDFAFAGCGLISITLGTNVTSIGNSAFSQCKMASVTIPSSVTSFGNGAFGWCASLGAITVNTNNSFYSSTNGVLFNKNQTTLVQFPAGVVGSYTMPNSVTSIQAGAFAGCGLTNVIISTNVTSVDQEAFEESGLTSVTIPNSVTNI